MKLTSIPIQNDQVNMYVHDSLGYVFFPEGGKVRVINPTGVDVWNAINGSNTIQNIIQQLTDLYDQNSHSLQIEVMNFLLQLKNRSLIYLKEE